MNLKIDTKEKFHEIQIVETHVTANMATDITNSLNAYLQTEIKNIILRFTNIQSIDIEAVKAIILLQQKFYANNASFVICEVQPQVKKSLDEAEILETMNITPTLSEAWDIVQMEEIERAFLEEE